MSEKNKMNLTSPGLLLPPHLASPQAGEEDLKRRGTRKIIAIVGPTASGKTAVGIRLAKKFNGEIVSADSRQIFRGLNLGTGKEGLPCQQETITKKQDTNNQQFNNKTIEQLRRDLRHIDNIPQWLIDVADPEEDFNLFKYLELARKAIEDIFSRGKLPIVVGGTGLYVQALLEGFELEQNHELRIMNHGIYSRGQLGAMTIEQLQDILQKIDSKVFEGLADKKNPHRLIRAIERAQEGSSMTKKKPDFEVLQIGLEWPREILNQRIDKRVDERFREGMLQEVLDLIKRKVDENWLKKLGLEYREITDFLQQIAKLLNCSTADLNNETIKQYNNEFEQMSNLLKLRSHQYAKRQMTWFKRFPEIVWENDSEKIKNIVGKFLN